MNKNAIIFAMANPVPEIRSDVAKEAGTLLAKVSQITEDIKLAAARALVDMVLESELESECILPEAFTEGVADQVAEAVKSVANKEA